jgi:ABC-type multidrug transport system fused ATPase/permease subunit
VDAHNAFVRLQEVFEAESLPDEQTKNFELDNALEVDGASFTWDAPPPEPEGAKDKGKGKDKNKKAKDPKKDKGKKKSETDADATITPASGSVPGSSRASTSHEPEKVFKIPKTNMTIPKGQIVAIVGPVGSGKSSFLQGLIGEMRKETGSVKFAGSLSYCPQNAWIQVCLFASCSVILRHAKRIAERYHP